MSTQLYPSPLKPASQAHLNEPSELMHCAFWSQPPLLVKHSLMSLQVMPFPVKPS